MTKKQPTKNVSSSSSVSDPSPLPKTPVSVITTNNNQLTPDRDDFTSHVMNIPDSIMHHHHQRDIKESPITPTQPDSSSSSLLVSPNVDQPLTPPLTPTMKPDPTGLKGSPYTTTGSALISLITNSLPTPIRSEAEKLTQAVVAKRDSVLESAVGTVSAVRDTAVNGVCTVRNQAINTVYQVKDSAVNKVSGVCDDALSTIALVKNSAIATMSGACHSVTSTLESYPIVNNLVTQLSQVSHYTTNYIRDKHQYSMNIVNTSVMTPISNTIHHVKCKAVQVQSITTQLSCDCIQQLQGCMNYIPMPSMKPITNVISTGIEMIGTQFKTGITNLTSMGMGIKQNVETWINMTYQSGTQFVQQQKMGGSDGVTNQYVQEVARWTGWVLGMIQSDPRVQWMGDKLGVTMNINNMKTTKVE